MVRIFRGGIYVVYIVRNVFFEEGVGGLRGEGASFGVFMRRVLGGRIFYLGFCRWEVRASGLSV